MTAADPVLASVDAAADEIVDFTRELIRLPTVNPPGDGYTDCAELIGRRLTACGFETTYLAAEGCPEHTTRHPRINVVGRRGRARPLVHLNGHFDVVPAGAGWTLDPFAGIVRDGRIYGRGSCDMKAGIAAAVYAAEAIRRAGVELNGTVEISGTVDEESGGFAGVAWLAQRGHISASRTDYVIIPEPLYVDRICIGHRGVYWFEITTHGRIAHGSMPFHGVNAIEHMGILLDRIRRDLLPSLAGRSTTMPIEPAGARRATLNVNGIDGGQPVDGIQTPCVADRCRAIFDRRFLLEEGFDRTRAEIVDLLERAAAEVPDFRYEIRDLMVVHPVRDTGRFAAHRRSRSRPAARAGTERRAGGQSGHIRSQARHPHWRGDQLRGLRTWYPRSSASTRRVVRRRRPHQRDQSHRARADGFDRDTAMKSHVFLAVAFSAASVLSSSAGAQSAGHNITLTAVDGVKVGHFTLTDRPTGCTVVLVKDDTTGGVDVRGGAPGTRETDLLNPVNSVQIVNAITLSGGSAFGLDAASGVMQWLDEHNIGYPRRRERRRADRAGGDPVRSRVRRQSEDPARRGLRLPSRGGRRERAPVTEGNVGAGAGATVGKSGRPAAADEGRASARRPSPAERAGRRRARRGQRRRRHHRPGDRPGDRRHPDRGRQASPTRASCCAAGAGREGRPGENTTIGIVATNARLTKVQAQKVAQMAHDGYARAIAPVHTPGDGDTIFSLATGTWTGEVNYGTIGSLAAEVMADAIVRAATQAASSAGVPSAKELGTVPARLRQ